MNNPHEQRDVFGHLLMIVFFYINYYLLLPRLVNRPGLGWYIPVVLLALVLITIIPNLILPEISPGDHPDEHRMHFHQAPAIPAMPPPPDHHHSRPDGRKVFRHIGHNFWIFLVLVFFSFSLYMLIRWRAMQRDKLNAELMMLKAQVHPHFLFNTLNSIYGTALEEKSPQTATAVMRLSGILRYVLNDDKADYIPLERELSFIKDYIDLQKTRLGETVSVWFEVNGNPGDLVIAPLILITLVENAFRHGVSPEETSEVRFTADISGGVLEFRAVNRKMLLWKSNNFIGSHNIENIRRRLDHYYPQRHLLHIIDSNENFTVVLNIRLQ